MARVFSLLAGLLSVSITLANILNDGTNKVNMSQVLDSLLEGYDKRLRPGFGALEIRPMAGNSVVVSCDGAWQWRGFSSRNGVATVLSVNQQRSANVLDVEGGRNYYHACPISRKTFSYNNFQLWREKHTEAGQAVVVNADLSLRSMGPISELDMMYTLDCYFRQRWMDRRLAMNISIENLTLGIKILERIWHPDTVFYNGQKSYLHAITSYNRFLRIGANGTVLFSQRLTIQASCRMNLEYFPMDIQNCPLLFGSFAYSTDDVIYKWRYGQSKSIELAPDLRLSQFDLVGFPVTNYTGRVKEDLHSVLKVTFKLSRHTGYFLINLYLPCCLLVVLSWVSFWINREATADRIALGSTTVLTMTIIAIENKSQLPKVSYVTAMDVYVALCFVFVLATTLEFAMVHYFTKYGTGEPLMLSSDDDSSTDELSEENTSLDSMSLGNGKFKIQKYPWPPNEANVKVGVMAKLCHCLTRTKSKFRKGKLTAFSNSVSQVDRASRILFPLTFTILNVVYCVAYYLWAFSGQ